MRQPTAEYAEMAYIRKVIKKIHVDEMAAEIGMSVESYRRTERGERDLTLKQAFQIANKFGMPFEEVFPKFFTPNVARDATSGTS